MKLFCLSFGLNIVSGSMLRDFFHANSSVAFSKRTSACRASRAELAHVDFRLFAAERAIALRGWGC